MKGQLKVGRQVPFFVAVPTTAGTGSETTIAAVVTDDAENHKYAINDPVLVPDYAVMDPSLTVSLPADITAATGMDALTHAVEAYLELDLPHGRDYRILRRGSHGDHGIFAGSLRTGRFSGSQRRNADRIL